jgi:hypothetical protein
MRILITGLACLLALSVAVTANADENDLVSAVFVAHHPPDFVYSAGEDWTAKYYSDFALTSLYEVNTFIPDGEFTSTENQAIWYVLVAFCDGEEKTWGGTQFGLGQFDTNAFYITGGGICLPGGLEIPSSGSWPGPEEGIAIAATSTNWQGNFEPIHWFSGYQYSGTTMISITGFERDGNPQSCQLGSVTTPAVTYEITEPTAFGALGVGSPGLIPECGVTWYDEITWGVVKTLYK